MLSDVLTEFEEQCEVKVFVKTEIINVLKKDLYSSKKIFAVIEPMSAKEMRNLPNGQDSFSWFSVWANKKYRIKLKDKICINNSEYEIQKISEWNYHGDYMEYGVVDRSQKVK